MVIFTEFTTDKKYYGKTIRDITMKFLGLALNITPLGMK